MNAWLEKPLVVVSVNMVTWSDNVIVFFVGIWIRRVPAQNFLVINFFHVSHIGFFFEQLSKSKIFITGHFQGVQINL